MASTSESTGVRSFSGDMEDAKEYKRWKTWIINKMLTLGDKVPKEARGAYVYALLQGKASSVLNIWSQLSIIKMVENELSSPCWTHAFLRKIAVTRCPRC